MANQDSVSDMSYQVTAATEEPRSDNAEHGERQAVQPSFSTDFIFPIQDLLASVDGLQRSWPGLELGPLGAKTKGQVSDFN